MYDSFCFSPSSRIRKYLVPYCLILGACCEAMSGTSPGRTGGCLVCWLGTTEAVVDTAFGFFGVLRSWIVTKQCLPMQPRSGESGD